MVTPTIQHETKFLKAKLHRLCIHVHNALVDEQRPVGGSLKITARHQGTQSDRPIPTDTDHCGHAFSLKRSAARSASESESQSSVQRLKRSTCHRLFRPSYLICRIDILSDHAYDKTVKNKPAQ